MSLRRSFVGAALRGRPFAIQCSLNDVEIACADSSSQPFNSCCGAIFPSA